MLASPLVRTRDLSVVRPGLPVEMPHPGEDVQEAEEEHMKDLCNKYGIAYDDGVKIRPKPPKIRQPSTGKPRNTVSYSPADDED